MAGRPLLKEIEAAGFAWVQVPAPPPPSCSTPRIGPPRRGLGAALGTTGLRAVVHGPGALQVGGRDGDRAMEGLLIYAAEVGA